MNPRGISSNLPGASSLGVGCVCDKIERQWMMKEDGFNTTMCVRCGRAWHYCPQHNSEVSGLPNYAAPMLCSCKKTWMPTGSNCPACGEKEYLIPYESTTTKICKRCGNAYHTCPLDGRSVPGPGYHRSAREQTMCQCHENLPFLNKEWARPFQ